MGRKKKEEVAPAQDVEDAQGSGEAETPRTDCQFCGRTDCCNMKG